MPEVILDTEDAGTATGLTSRRIRQLVAEGKIENVGAPRRIRVRLSEVLAVAGDPLNLAH